MWGKGCVVCICYVNKGWTGVLCFHWAEADWLPPVKMSYDRIMNQMPHYLLHELKPLMNLCVSSFDSPVIFLFLILFLLFFLLWSGWESEAQDVVHPSRTLFSPSVTSAEQITAALRNLASGHLLYILSYLYWMEEAVGGGGVGWGCGGVGAVLCCSAMNLHSTRWDPCCNLTLRNSLMANSHGAHLLTADKLNHAVKLNHGVSQRAHAPQALIYMSPATVYRNRRTISTG